MALMPSFRRRKKAASVIARLIAGFGELELTLAKCAGVALAHKRLPKLPASGFNKYAHRIRYENFGIKLIFRLRGEKCRIDATSKLARKPFRQFGLESELDQALGAARACLQFRNLFAHCHWTQSKKRGLFFISLEDVARLPEPLNLSAFRYASVKNLTEAEDYFFHTMQLLEYVADEFAVRAELLRFHGSVKPKKRPQLNPDTKLFPHRNPH